jgi:hypothetical protein
MSLHTCIQQQHPLILVLPSKTEQNESGRMANILGGISIGNFDKKNYMNMWLILNGYRGRALRIYSILNGKEENILFTVQFILTF